jgi:hypothetical protein
MWKRRTNTSLEVAPVADDFHDWAANQPFVVERAHGLSETVRVYDVDCEPLGQRRTWLILDFETADSMRPTSITVLLPRKVAAMAARAEWGRSYGPTRDDQTVLECARADRVIFRVDPLAGRRSVEAVVLGAYRSIIDWS